MKYSTRLSDTLHLLAFICLTEGASLSSARIAESIQTNPAYVRQLMSLLKKADLLTNTQGQANPRITRPAEEITMLDVYRAVEGEKPLLHMDTHTNPGCGVGIYVQMAIADCYQEIQDVAEKKMSQITLADILKQYCQRMGREMVGVGISGLHPDEADI